MNCKLFKVKSLGGTALVAVAIGVIGSSGAGATVQVGAINCTAHAVLLPSTVLGDVALQNPTESHVQGPVWAAQGSAFSLVTPPSVAILPSSAGGQTVSKYTDITTAA
mgnify:FL=1